MPVFTQSAQFAGAGYFKCCEYEITVVQNSLTSPLSLAAQITQHASGMRGTYGTYID